MMRETLQDQFLEHIISLDDHQSETHENMENRNTPMTSEKKMHTSTYLLKPASMFFSLIAAGWASVSSSWACFGEVATSRYSTCR